MAVYKLQLKNKQFSIFSTAWDKGKSIYKRLKGWFSRKPALIPKGPASDVIYNATNGAKATGYAAMAGQGGNAAAKATQETAKKSGGYLRGTRDEYIEALHNRKQAARGGAKGGNNGANSGKGNNGANANNGNANNSNVKNNQNQNQPKQGNKGNKKPGVYDAGNGKVMTFKKSRTDMPNANGFTTTLSGNPYNFGGYSGFKYKYN